MNRMAVWALALIFQLMVAGAHAATLTGRVGGVHDAGSTMTIKYDRSSAAKRIFRAEHACPSTGKHRGQCPGYVIGHRTPLCAGGEDHPRNMQWQTIEEGKTKDQRERQQCSRER